MRWYFASILWISALALWGVPGTVSAKKASRLYKKRARFTAVHPSLQKATPRPPATNPDLLSKSDEPIPAGEQAVYWARPLRLRPGLKIRSTAQSSATSLGEVRGDTEIAVSDRLYPRTAGDQCSQWLKAIPEGYLCRNEVELRPGYLSDPPNSERPPSWQRFRYGVVKVASATLQYATGQPASEAGYLRGPLHRGDGITVVRELSDRVQVYGKQWLRKMDVALTTPPALAPIALQKIAPAQRFMVAWAVPPPGESQVAVHVAGQPEAPPLWLPRYSQLYFTDGKASPGRILVYLSEGARAALGTRPDAATPEATAATRKGAALEIDARSLRRITPTAPPIDLKPEERWIDISLSEQVAIAYLGPNPLFAALVSTGQGTTPPGSFAIYRKYVTQTMANMRGAAAQYDFREVPFAQFFNGRIGLHAVLWHDLLGHPVSHGCVNMSPAAAEQFFAFTQPDMPSGWHTINSGNAQTSPFRGTRVVVRR